MALQPFNPIANQTTHADAKDLFNNNFAETESRLQNLESYVLPSQSEIFSSSGTLTVDGSLRSVLAVILTEDVTLSIQNAQTGDSGMILVRQDATGSHSLTSSGKVLSGLLSAISSITPETGIASINWYYDGIDYLLYVSSAS